MKTAPRKPPAAKPPPDPVTTLLRQATSPRVRRWLEALLRRGEPAAAPAPASTERRPA
jgi:hypothetical protein